MIVDCLCTWESLVRLDSAACHLDPELRSLCIHSAVVRLTKIVYFICNLTYCAMRTEEAVAAIRSLPEFRMEAVDGQWTLVCKACHPEENTHCNVRKNRGRVNSVKSAEKHLSNFHADGCPAGPSTSVPRLHSGQRITPIDGANSQSVPRCLRFQSTHSDQPDSCGDARLTWN